MEYENLIDIILMEEGWEYGIVLTNKRLIFYRPVPLVDLDLFSSFEELILFIFIGVFLLFYYGILGRIYELLVEALIGIGIIFVLFLIFIISSFFAIIHYKKIINYIKQHKKYSYNQPRINQDPEFLKEIEKFKVFEILNDEIENVRILKSKNMICIEITTVDGNKIKNYYYPGFKKVDLNELVYNIKLKFVKSLGASKVFVEF